MKPFRFTAVPAVPAALVVLAAGCSSTWSPQTVQHIPADTDTCIRCANHSPTHVDTTSKRPVLSVGVSDPDTQLILPWFLTDIINAVNAH